LDVCQTGLGIAGITLLGDALAAGACLQLHHLDVEENTDSIEDEQYDQNKNAGIALFNAIDASPWSQMERLEICFKEHGGASNTPSHARISGTCISLVCVCLVWRGT
jgi:hypothetical protein